MHLLLQDHVQEMSLVIRFDPTCISAALDGEGEEGAPVSLGCQHPALVKSRWQLEGARHPPKLVKKVEMRSISSELLEYLLCVCRVRGLEERETMRGQARVGKMEEREKTVCCPTSVCSS
jgi:hypothetical protein